jgi:hypothetical protein
MKADQNDNLAGIYEQDGSVKCRDCMEDEDWKHLSRQNVITLDDVKNGERLFYCDYCEEKL